MTEQIKSQVFKARRRGVGMAIAIACISAAIALFVSRGGDYSASSIRTADITVDDKIILGSGSAGIYQYTGDPNAHIGAVKGSFTIDTSTPAIWQNTTGSNVWTQAGGSGSGGGGGGGSAGYGSGLGSGAITVTVANSVSTNLSTLGTIDWMHSSLVGTSAMSRSVTTLTPNGTAGVAMKKTGGGILLVPGIDYFGGAGGSTPGTIASSCCTMTSSAGDNAGSAALSSTNVNYYPTVINQGIRFMLPTPGGNIQRVARVYIWHNSDEIVCLAHAQDLSAGDGSGSSVESVGTAKEVTFTVTYTTNTAGYVVLLCYHAATTTGTSRIGYAAVTLGPS